MDLNSMQKSKNISSFSKRVLKQKRSKPIKHETFINRFMHCRCFPITLLNISPTLYLSTQYSEKPENDSKTKNTICKRFMQKTS